MAYIIIALAVSLFMCLLYSAKQFPAICAWGGGISGIAVLFAAHLFGFGVGFNPFTCGVCAVLGAPGAVGLLGLKIILKC